MHFLTSFSAIISEAYLIDVEVKDVHGENETVVLCNLWSSFSSELHDLLLGCRFDCIRAL